MKNIVIIGLGYVGLANGLFLARKHNVVGVDISKNKIDKLNKRISPLDDNEIKMELLSTNMKFTTDKDIYKTSEYIFIAVPTNYDEVNNYFDMSLVTNTIKEILSVNRNCKIIIKSTIPIGYTEEVKKEVNYNNIIFMPEFLREGRALYDCIYPDRIIVGTDMENGQDIMQLYSHCKTKEKLFMPSTEAEAVKLFSNTYLAMRVSFFNELDTFSQVKNLNTAYIIKGVSADSRIGNNYNNPSFGYGGYCLPKDTKQLMSNYNNIPEALISAIVASNSIRKSFIVDTIKNKKPQTVGVYKLAMKAGSDNYRCSAIIDIINKLKSFGIDCIIYDESLETSEFMNFKVYKDFKEFVKASDIILANRLDKRLDKVSDKVYSCDKFNMD